MSTLPSPASALSTVTVMLAPLSSVLPDIAMVRRNLSAGRSKWGVELEERTMKSLQSF
jgi:hypothetical protein